MKDLKYIWDNLSQYKKQFIIKNNLFWDGLLHFKYDQLPIEFKKILKKYNK